MNAQDNYEYHKLLKFLYFEGYSDSYEEAEYVLEELNCDGVLEYLIDEGYSDTFENAVVILENMSEEWRESIVEEITPERRARYKRGLAIRQSNQEVVGKGKSRKRATSPQPGAQHYRKGMTQSHRDTMRDAEREENPERPEGSGSLPKGKKLERQRKTGVSAD
jgi:hypothetical protein